MSFITKTRVVDPDGVDPDPDPLPLKKPDPDRTLEKTNSTKYFFSFDIKVNIINILSDQGMMANPDPTVKTTLLPDPDPQPITKTNPGALPLLY